MERKVGSTIVVSEKHYASKARGKRGTILEKVRGIYRVRLDGYAPYGHGPYGDEWAMIDDDFVTPTFVNDLRLKPQSKTVLSHLKKIGHITPMQALAVYGIPRLAAAIYDIRKIGYTVDKQMRVDASGHKYARYSLVLLNG